MSRKGRKGSGEDQFHMSSGPLRVTVTWKGEPSSVERSVPGHAYFNGTPHQGLDGHCESIGAGRGTGKQAIVCEQH